MFLDDGVTELRYFNITPNGHELNTHPHNLLHSHSHTLILSYSVTLTPRLPHTTKRTTLCKFCYSGHSSCNTIVKPLTIYTYDQFLELDSESQLAFVQKEGTIILEQKCSYFHSVIYGLGSFNVETVDDLATGKAMIKRTYSSLAHFSGQPAYYK